MKIVSLVDNNTQNSRYKAVHGLSFYIETDNHKILFDLGPNKTFLRNAEMKGIDLSKVDTVVISHGHFDHGGGLSAFLAVNNSAKIYIRRSAFEKHYCKVLFLAFSVGIKKSLMNRNQIVLLDGNYDIDDELRIFQAVGDTLISPCNKTLLDKNKQTDKFEHEQNLLVKSDKNVLFAGCSHKGFVNILNGTNETIDIYIGGFHTMGKTVDDDYIDGLCERIARFDGKVYTCHCTGLKNFSKIAERCSNVSYIYVGNELVV